jgi:cobalt-zinc-cadmium efflux system outer membrane protein
MIAGVSVPIPIFDWNRGEIQRAMSDTLATEKELSWAERRVAAEVQGAYEAHQQLAAQAGGQQESMVTRAAEAHAITVAAYQEGAASLLQVLDATRTLVDVRLTYSRTLLTEQQNAFDLSLAAGIEPLSSVLILQPGPVTPVSAGAGR